MSWYVYVLAILAGFLSGFINTVAGSGSLVTLPLLIYIGLPANVANGTNRVSILFQNIVGGYSFHKKGVLDLRGTLLLGIPAVIGSVIGAQIAVNLNEEVMRRVIGYLMVVMLGVVIFQPERWLKGASDKIIETPGLWKYLLFFLIGVYGGFIQVGVGIFLLAALVLGAGYDLVRGNAVKVGIVLLFTISSILIFMKNNQVEWFIGTIMALGSMVGAWIGAKMAVEKGAVWVRRLLILIVVIAAADLLGLTQLVANLFS